MKIFIGTDDPDTRKAFSELCGNRKLKNFSVNTNVENPTSGNTGATNQPLITPGELETLNGDEKGNAIVSVRGYHPIWTKFTPSFTLQNIYFPEGKTGFEEKHARLFDKDEIVFDIMDESRKKDEAAQYEDLRQKDEEDLQNVQNARKPLDESWQKIRDEIDNRLRTTCEMLEDQDAQDVMNAPLEDKANLLFILMQQYADSIAQSLRRTSEYLNDAVPQLKRLQMQAVK